MNKREIAVLTIKLMALFVVSQAVIRFNVDGSKWYVSILSFLFSAGIALGWGLLLWISADPIAKRIFRDDAMGSSVPLTSYTPGEVMELVIGLIGVWLVVTTGPSLITQAAFHLVSRSTAYESAIGSSTPQLREAYMYMNVVIVGVLVEFLLGLFFVLNPVKVVNLIDRLQARIRGSSHTQTSGNVNNQKNEKSEDEAL